MMVDGWTAGLMAIIGVGIFTLTLAVLGLNSQRR